MHRGLKANYLPMVALKNRDCVDDGDYRGGRITRRILKRQIKGFLSSYRSERRATPAPHSLRPRQKQDELLGREIGILLYNIFVTIAHIDCY